MVQKGPVEKDHGKSNNSDTCRIWKPSSDRDPLQQSNPISSLYMIIPIQSSLKCFKKCKLTHLARQDSHFKIAFFRKVSVA